MPSLKKYAPHGLASGKTPADALEAVRNGDLVVPPFGGPMAGLPSHLDLMAFSIFSDDFYRLEEAGTNIGGWKQNDIGDGITGPVISASYSLNGEIDFATSDDAAGDGAHFQWDTDGIISLAPTQPYWFTIRVNIPVPVANVHIRCGCCATTANPYAADPEGVYFVIGETVDGAVGTIVKNGEGTTETAATGSSLAAFTWHELAWRYDGTDVKFYLDRALIDTVTTNIPVTFALEPFFGAISRGAAAEKVMAVDFIQVVTLRPEDG
jgi:hypothetical protein